MLHKTSGHITEFRPQVSYFTTHCILKYLLIPLQFTMNLKWILLQFNQLSTTFLYVTLQFQNTHPPNYSHTISVWCRTDLQKWQNSTKWCSPMSKNNFQAAAGTHSVTGYCQTAVCFTLLIHRMQNFAVQFTSVLLTTG